MKVNIGNLGKKTALTLDLQKAQLSPLMTSVPSHYGPTMSHHGTQPIFSRKKRKIEYATACHCHACVPLDRPILRQRNMTTNNRSCLTHYTYTCTSSCSLKYTIRYSVKTLTFPMVGVKLVVLQPSARPWPLSENVPWVTSVVPHLFWPLPFFGPQDAVEAPRAQGGCVGQPPPNNHA